MMKSNYAPMRSNSIPLKFQSAKDRRKRVIKNTLKRLRFFQRRRYRKNLILLHDVLESTRFAKRFWITNGLLLGWARNRRIIPWDFDDADFGYFPEDRDKFIEVQANLTDAGFELKTINHKPHDIVHRYVFVKDNTRFEFFEMKKKGTKINYTYLLTRNGIKYKMDCTIPMHGFEEIKFVGRTWLKPDDHELNLTAIYGNWRKPDPGYFYADDDKSIVDIYPDIEK